MAQKPAALSYNYDGPEGRVFEHWRKARKEHTCEVCVTAIDPGQRYLSSWCAAWGTSALHEGCEAMVRQLYKEMGMEQGEGVAYHDVEAIAADYGYSFDADAHAWSKAAADA